MAVATKEELLKVAVDVVHKFGFHPSVGTSFEPISIGGVYQTPQVGSATALRVKAGNAADTADGDGARSVYIQGLNASGELTSEVIPTAGESAGANSTNSYIRLFRAFVYTSGSYATSAGGSHTAAVVIENAAGSADWATMSATGFDMGQTQIAAYSVPLGYTAYIADIEINVDSTKSADVILFQRQDILQTAAPYSSMRAVEQFSGIKNELHIEYDIPLGPFPALTDIGFMGTHASTAAGISVSFTIILLRNS